MTEKPKKQIVKMDNVLVRARHGLSLSEKRLVALSMTKSNDFNKGQGIEITAQEFSEAYDIHPKEAYNQLKSAISDLMERKVTFQIRDGKAIGQRVAVWVQGADYFEGEGFARLHFAPILFPLLFSLKEKFTQYNLETAKALRSHYSWRLMEMLERFRNAPQDKNGFNFWQSTVEELHLTFEAPASCQNHFGAFKQKIINTSVKEVNEKTAWIVKWEPIKTGRKITSIKFLFKLDEQLKLGLDG